MSSTPEAPPPRGLVLFPPGTPPELKRRRLVAAFVLLLAGAAVIWPIYPLFAAASPRFLGMPLSLVWPLLSLGAVFALLLWLFRHDHR